MNKNQQIENYGKPALGKVPAPGEFLADPFAGPLSRNRDSFQVGRELHFMDLGSMGSGGSAA